MGKRGLGAGFGLGARDDGGGGADLCLPELCLVILE